MADDDEGPRPPASVADLAWAPERARQFGQRALDLSNAELDGRHVLRACIVNFRTEAGDVDVTLDAAAELGAKLDEELRPEALRPMG
jgi:hypothetical protein